MESHSAGDYSAVEGRAGLRENPIIKKFYLMTVFLHIGIIGRD